MSHNQAAMIEAHKAGRDAARNHVSRHNVNETAIHCLTVDEGDAYLAGYYAELRRIKAALDERAALRVEFDAYD